MPEVDYLIVGSGIAGVTLAELLYRREQNFLLVHHSMPGEASRASAGVINPVTGMRFVLSWEFQNLERVFCPFYKSLERDHKKSYLREMSLYQLLESPLEENAWLERKQDPYYQTYIGGIEMPNEWTSIFKKGEKYGKVEKAYVVDVNQLMDDVLSKFLEKGLALASYFDYNDFFRSREEIIWKNLRIKKAIIFAEGFLVTSNPFFNWLPSIPLKGDCLSFQSNQIKLDCMVKKAHAIVPMGLNSIWCGASFVLNDTTLNCDDVEQQNLIEFLNVHNINDRGNLRHMFGIRPASRDRRPLLGPHPLDSRLVVFNGLGTKGLSLAPYCAELLVEWLLSGLDLPTTVSLSRLARKGIFPPSLAAD